MPYVLAVAHNVGYGLASLPTTTPSCRARTADASDAVAILARDEGETVVLDLPAPVQSRPRESEQGDKWSFCLTAGTLCPANQERQ